MKTFKRAVHRYFKDLLKGLLESMYCSTKDTMNVLPLLVIWNMWQARKNIIPIIRRRLNAMAIVTSIAVVGSQVDVE